MSSSEQTGLTIVGAAAGFFLSGGNPAFALYGAQIGYTIGLPGANPVLPSADVAGHACGLTKQSQEPSP